MKPFTYSFGFIAIWANAAAAMDSYGNGNLFMASLSASLALFIATLISTVR
jgi:hypothetical protein